MSKAICCTVCKSKFFSLKNSEMSVYECKQCTHEFTILSPEQQEPYSQEYFLKTHKNWFLNPDFNLYRSVIQSIKKPDAKVLDIGCGTGTFLKYFSTENRKASLFGIDLITNKADGVTFIQGDFDTYQFDTKFDVITGFMVVEHMKDPRVFVEKIHSLLNPHGKLILNTINSSGLLYNIANVLKYLGWQGPSKRLYDHHHLQHYSFESFERLVKDFKFTILEHRTHNFPLAAVDVPEDNYLLKVLYKMGVTATFGLNYCFGQGMNQTIMCEKRT